MPAKQIVMKPSNKPCKHVIRFETQDPTAHVSNVYVSKGFPGIETAKAIVVSIEATSLASA